MSACAATALGVPDEEVLICSTGRIGARLPMEKIEAGIRAAATRLASAPDASQVPLAIMTTDTRPKFITADVPVAGGSVRLTACCKGAGMIEPNMATMLCYLLTDAGVSPADLLKLLRDTVHGSFNRVSVDGDTSTNDTVLALANGASGLTLVPGSADWSAFARAFEAVCLEMAIQIVKDGEGVTKFITLDVLGACSDAEADAAARSVANSYLVKTGWAGTYPVWGRIMDSIGYSPAKVEENKVSIDYDQVAVARNGVFAGSKQEDIDAVTRKPAYTIRIDLGLGKGAARVYTCDCTEEYVRINMF
jgi:glutamate N-acetyltransferase/amino-acid N-acetyltransferase